MPARFVCVIAFTSTEAASPTCRYVALDELPDILRSPAQHAARSHQRFLNVADGVIQDVVLIT